MDPVIPIHRKVCGVIRFLQVGQQFYQLYTLTEPFFGGGGDCKTWCHGTTLCLNLTGDYMKSNAVVYVSFVCTKIILCFFKSRNWTLIVE